MNIQRNGAQPSAQGPADYFTGPVRVDPLPIEAIRPGDVVWIEPGEKHWHGAAATTAMTHIALVEHLDGKTADWMERVSDAQFGAASAGLA